MKSGFRLTIASSEAYPPEATPRSPAALNSPSAVRSGLSKLALPCTRPRRKPAHIACRSLPAVPRKPAEADDLLGIGRRYHQLIGADIHRGDARKAGRGRGPEACAAERRKACDDNRQE